MIAADGVRRAGIVAYTASLRLSETQPEPGAGVTERHALQQ